MSLLAVSFHPAAESSQKMLMGPESVRAILKISPDWKAGYEKYEPDGSALDRLRQSASALENDLAIDVIFGSWCGDSREQVPKFLKIQHEIGRKLLPAKLLAVDRSKKNPEDAVAGKGIERVPTFIVYWKGVEIGRIVETPKSSVEADLAEILAHPGRP
jgi:thiol-disulfide isomerase/thioredoxin